jgi:hypothetical protein
MTTMVFAGIRRQVSCVEKGEFVMGVVMEFFEAKFRLGEVWCVVSARPKTRERGGLILELGGLRAH